MFTVVTTVMASLSLGQNVETVAGRVADRLDKLDRLVLDVTHTLYGIAHDGSALDQQRWLGPFGGEYPHRLTIVRPNVSDMFLRDEPAIGYEPLTAVLHNGEYVSLNRRPTNRGESGYIRVVNSGRAGVFLWCPILQIFDLQLHDSTIPQLNVLRLLQEYDARLVRETGDVQTFACGGVPMRGFTTEYEFDINSRGTPLRVATVITPGERELKPIRFEQFVLATSECNGAELPIEAIVVIENANVQRERNIHHFCVTHVETRGDLTDDDVNIVPVLRNAVLSEYRLDGTATHTHYNADGNVTLQQSTLGAGPEPIDPNAHASLDSLRWRMAIPVLACACGACVALALNRTTGRRRAI